MCMLVSRQVLLSCKNEVGLLISGMRAMPAIMLNGGSFGSCTAMYSLNALCVLGC